MKSVGMVLLLAFVLVGCQTPETKVVSADESFVRRTYEFDKIHRPVRITRETKILDSRSFFEYRMARLPGSVNVVPGDYDLTGYYGELLGTEAQKRARRLALYGVTPLSHVVIITTKKNMSSSVGNMALSLLMMGIERVQLVDASSYSAQLTAMAPKPLPKNKRDWEPRLIKSIQCSPVPGKVPFLIDTSVKKNLRRAASAQVRLRKPWRFFISSSDLSPGLDVGIYLRKNDVLKDSKIQVSGPYRSLVVFQLLRLGYLRACALNEA